VAGRRRLRGDPVTLGDLVLDGERDVRRGPVQLAVVGLVGPSPDDARRMAHVLLGDETIDLVLLDLVPDLVDEALDQSLVGCRHLSLLRLRSGPV
jgi:hypothetical protein